MKKATKIFLLERKKLILWVSTLLISFFILTVSYSIIISLIMSFLSNDKKWFQFLLNKKTITYSVILDLISTAIFLYFYFDSKVKNKFTNKGKRIKDKNKINKELQRINENEKISLNKKVGLITTQLNRHTLLIGTNGSGKTTTALLTIKQLTNKFNQPVIIIDGKGDSDLIDKIQQEDPNALIWKIGDKETYNPLASKDPVMLADKIMSLFNFSEPHYETIAHEYLLLVTKTLIQKYVPITFDNIIKFFSIRELKKLIGSESPKYSYIKGFNEKDINGLLGRLRIIKEQLNSSIDIGNDLSKLIKNHKIILFSLDSLSYPKLASNVGKLIVQDLKEFVNIKPKELELNLVFDEFNVFADENIVNLINKSRSKNFQCFLCFQTIADLKTKEKDLTDIIFGNVANIIAHKVIDPNSAEYISKVFGTRSNEKITELIDKKDKTGKGSLREVEEYIVHPNDLKNLKTGEAFVKILLPSSNQYVDKIKINISN